MKKPAKESAAVQQRLRDVISGPLTFDYFQERLAAGWVPVAMEWIKPSAAARTGTEVSGAGGQTPPRVETPYGFRVG